MTTIADQKAALRAGALARRKLFDPAAGEALAEVVLAGLDLPACSTIGGIWPLPGEMDLRPLMVAFYGRGHRIVLPETPPRGHPLVFREWSPGCTMIAERFGTLRPDGRMDEPDFIFVPLLAFDGRGYRLGYGGGYYDRTLQALPHARAIGFGYAAQRVEHVPNEAHDIRLPRIATELGILDMVE